MQNSQSVIQPKKKKGGACRTISIVFGVFFILLFICCSCTLGFSYFAFQSGIRQLGNEGYDLLCQEYSATEIESFYQNNTTEEYRNENTKEDLEAEFDQLKNGTCDRLKDYSFSKLAEDITSGGGVDNFSINTSVENGETITTIDIPINNQRITAEFIEDDGGTVLLNAFEVEPK